MISKRSMRRNFRPRRKVSRSKSRTSGTPSLARKEWWECSMTSLDKMWPTFTRPSVKSSSRCNLTFSTDSTRHKLRFKTALKISRVKSSLPIGHLRLGKMWDRLDRMVKLIMLLVVWGLFRWMKNPTKTSAWSSMVTLRTFMLLQATKLPSNLIWASYVKRISNTKLTQVSRRSSSLALRSWLRVSS